jgi:hypothetical protein
MPFGFHVYQKAYVEDLKQQIAQLQDERRTLLERAIMIPPTPRPQTPPMLVPAPSRRRIEAVVAEIEQAERKRPEKSGPATNEPTDH